MSNSLRPCRLWPSRLLCPWDSPSQNPGVGYHALQDAVGAIQCLMKQPPGGLLQPRVKSWSWQNEETLQPFLAGILPRVLSLFLPTLPSECECSKLVGEAGILGRTVEKGEVRYREGEPGDQKGTLGPICSCSSPRQGWSSTGEAAARCRGFWGVIKVVEYCFFIFLIFIDWFGCVRAYWCTWAPHCIV